MNNFQIFNKDFALQQLPHKTDKVIIIADGFRLGQNMSFEIFYKNYFLTLNDFEVENTEVYLW